MPEEEEERGKEIEEFGRITGETSDTVVRKILFRGKEYIDIRKFFHGANYTGFSRKGISIPIEEFPEIMEFLKKAQAGL